MDILSLLFEKAIKIDTPLKVAKIVLQQEFMTIDVYVDFRRGGLLPCPRFSKLSTAYDTKEVRVRHLDFFQYK